MIWIHVRVYWHASNLSKNLKEKKEKKEGEEQEGAIVLL